MQNPLQPPSHYLMYHTKYLAKSQKAKYQRATNVLHVSYNCMLFRIFRILLYFAEERTLSGGTTTFMRNLINVVRVQGSKPFPWVTDIGDDYVAQLAKAMNGDKTSA